LFRKLEFPGEFVADFIQDKVTGDQIMGLQAKFED